MILKFKNSKGKTKGILRDTDKEPIFDKDKVKQIEDEIEEQKEEKSKKNKKDKS